MTQKEPRPRLEIPLKTLDKIIEIAAFLILIFLWCFTFFAYSQVQEIIPIHFDMSGHINKYGRKITLIFLPITATIIYIGLSLLNRHPEIFNYTRPITGENAARQYSIATRMLRFLKLSIAMVFLLSGVYSYMAATGKVGQWGPWLLPVIVAIVICPCAYYVVKLLRVQS